MRGINTRQFSQLIWVGIGYILGNIAEPLWRASSTVILVVGIAFMVLPRLPRVSKPIGMGMILASDVVQSFFVSIVANITGNVDAVTEEA